MTFPALFVGVWKLFFRGRRINMIASKKICMISAMIILCLLLGAGSSLAKELESASTPPSEFMDWVYHNKGNIVTTIFNWGLMGGYSDVPNGEWPKGSGRNYLAEINYWMGATLPSGDTVVANTNEDFMPLVNFAASEDDYRIRLSTDSVRYELDPDDTVGLGNSRPAYGWRTYSLETESWEYNQIYDPTSEAFFNGGPIALQESQYIMDDTRLGYPALGLLVSQTIYQWNYDYNKDYLFVVLQIKNISENDYTDFAFGLYCDFDVGGWYQGENGRLDDLVAYDTVENLAWIYDRDDYDAGWGASVVTGRMGTRYLETPGDLGMTAFRTDQWENLPEYDEGKYDRINSEQFDEPLPPTDQFYIQCTRGIDLPAGEVVRVVYALVAGQTDQKLIENSRMAQTVYDNYFTGPTPPVQPGLTAYPGDKMVKLVWGNAAEDSKDDMTGEEDFSGYKVFRSTNLGYTWGELEYNPDYESYGPDYIPIAVFRIDEETGLIPHTFIDSNLVNGFEYWYAVTAFDKGDEDIPIEPLQSARGRPGEDSSAIRTMPRTNPAGYYPIQQTVEHVVLGYGTPSEGSIAVELYDESAISRQDYKVAFTEDIYQTYWHLLDDFTGDTLLADQTDQTGNLELAEFVDGFQLVVMNNAERMPSEMVQTQFSGADTTVRLLEFFGSINELVGLPLGGDIHFRSTYEFRFTASGSEGYSWYDDVTPMQLPFEIWNTTFGYQVIAEIGDYNTNQIWEPELGEHIVVVNFEYDGSPHPEAFPWMHSWGFRFDLEYNGQTGDVFTFSGAPLNSADDEFHFSPPGVDALQAGQDLDRIKVVPNPYIAHAEWENWADERKIEFIHLPDKATVRIYTLSGDLVVTLDHDNGSGTAAWDIQSVNDQAVAPGIYYYHVDSPYGEKIGKFAIIK